MSFGLIISQKVHMIKTVVSLPKLLMPMLASLIRIRL